MLTRPYAETLHGVGTKQGDGSGTEWSVEGPYTEYDYFDANDAGDPFSEKFEVENSNGPESATGEDAVDAPVLRKETRQNDGVSDASEPPLAHAAIFRWRTYFEEWSDASEDDTEQNENQKEWTRGDDRRMADVHQNINDGEDGKCHHNGR